MDFTIITRLADLALACKATFVLAYFHATPNYRLHVSASFFAFGHVVANRRINLEDQPALTAVPSRASRGVCL